MQDAVLAPRVPASWGSGNRFVTTREIEAAARERLATEVVNFFDGGACDERTIAENRRAFGRWLLRPRHVPDAADVDPSSEMLGMRFPVPFFTAPWGMDGALDEEGFVAVARAHPSLGIPFVASRATSRT